MRNLLRDYERVIGKDKYELGHDVYDRCVKAFENESTLLCTLNEQEYNLALRLGFVDRGKTYGNKLFYYEATRDGINNLYDLLNEKDSI